MRSFPVRFCLDRLPLPWLEAILYRMRETWKWWSQGNLKNLKPETGDLLQIAAPAPKETVT